MNSYFLSNDALPEILKTVIDYSAKDIAKLSRECSILALQNIADSNFDLAHVYFNLAKEFMMIAIHRKQELADFELVI